MNQSKNALTVPPMRFQHKQALYQLFKNREKSKILNVHFGAHSDENDTVDSTSFTVELKNGMGHQILMCTFKDFLELYGAYQFERKNKADRIKSFMLRLFEKNNEKFYRFLGMMQK